MAILLGIDTGGTYTDAVLFNDSASQGSNGVISTAKALTTKYDLAIGIRNVINAVLNTPEASRTISGGSTPDSLHDIRLVSLSTTLATNAIVEGHGTPVCLLLLGYPGDSLNLANLKQALGSDPVVFIDGGHTVSGEEQTPLDVEAARRAILEYAPQVTAFAVSGYFAVRNPAHELAVRDLVRDLTGKPVSCGHELTSSLDAPRRALTTVINARLIPLLQQLIMAVRDILNEKGIHASLMVVKGDGSLIDANVALRQPVQTILSGPAASVVGARHLSGENDVLVVDMGGTTSDIALLQGGQPVLNLDGATVGGWRTMVEAVSVHTFGLGGDSELRLDDAERMVVGPRRVVPLSLLALQHPQVLDVLRAQLKKPVPSADDGLFALRQRPLDASSLPFDQQQVWALLAEGVLPLADLFAEPRIAYFRRVALAQLVDRGAVVLGGFTPSDAAHVLGNQADWSVEAAQLGALIWSRRLGDIASGELYSQPGTDPERKEPLPIQASGNIETAQSTLSTPVDGREIEVAREVSRRVIQQVVVQSGRALLTAALIEAHGIKLDDRDAAQRLLIDRSLETQPHQGDVLNVSLTLRRPIVAIGAPVATYYPPVAERLHTRLRIPPHADIANAVGAVAGGVMQTVRAQIKVLDGEQGYRVHLPSGIQDFANLPEAAEYAVHESQRLAESKAREAGAVNIQSQTHRQDHIARVHREEFYEDMYIDTEVTAIAFGRPRLAEKSPSAQP